MKYAKASATISGYRREIADIRHKMRKAMAEVEAETVADYEFTTVRCAGATAPSSSACPMRP